MCAARAAPPPPPPSRTKWTRLVHPSVLTGHGARWQAGFAPARAGNWRWSQDLTAEEEEEEPPPSPPRTKWTRRVPHPILTGHFSSLAPQEEEEEEDGDDVRRAMSRGLGPHQPL